MQLFLPSASKYHGLIRIGSFMISSPVLGIEFSSLKCDLKYIFICIYLHYRNDSVDFPSSTSDITDHTSILRQRSSPILWCDKKEIVLYELFIALVNLSLCVFYNRGVEFWTAPKWWNLGTETWVIPSKLMNLLSLGALESSIWVCLASRPLDLYPTGW